MLRVYLVRERGNEAINHTYYNTYNVESCLLEARLSLGVVISLDRLTASNTVLVKNMFVFDNGD
jgi:hypothetical protein